MEELGYRPVEDVYYIGLEELTVDPQNIRGGVWDHDEELVSSIRQGGVNQPLVVRPLDYNEDEVVNWGIVCGSRRYNASIEAGKEKAPCRVMTLNDVEAKLKSMEENRNRRDTPRWKDIEFVGEVTEDFLSEGYSYEDSAVEISEEVGMAEATITHYQDIYNMSDKLRGLLREPNEMSEKYENYLRSIDSYKKNAFPLKLGSISVVGEYLSNWEIPKQINAAIRLNGYKQETREMYAEKWKGQPHKSLDDIVRDSVNDTDQRTITFRTETLDRMADAAYDRNQIHTDLIRIIVKDWLDENEY